MLGQQMSVIKYKTVISRKVDKNIKISNYFIIYNNAISYLININNNYSNLKIFDIKNLCGTLNPGEK